MKKLGIKGKMICIIIPIILAIIISFFALSSNQIVKLAKEKLTATSLCFVFLRCLFLASFFLFGLFLATVFQKDNVRPST